MSITNKQWTLASLGLAVLVAALFALGGRYCAVLVLFLPLGVWLGVRREPEEARTRPWIRVVGCPRTVLGDLDVCNMGHGGYTATG